ncbi:MAG: transcriptional repressor LexA [Firmicutes bacterium]|nr:transcriptional repressor LexA [Bacillota bacterium]
MADLSSKQLQILEYLKQEVRDKGYPPSVREICEAIGLKSTSTVHGHLSRLEKKGLIRRDPTKPRAIEILDESFEDEYIEHRTQELIDVPIIGTITAGAPILAVENIEDTFPIPASYVNTNGNVFMLKVKGESMIEAGIFDKDLVLVRQQPSANNGEIIVALIDGDYATVKTFYKENGHIRLQPENSTMSPIIVSDCTVLGKVIGLFRRF